MKILAFILAFLVLGLSCLPCADDAFARNDNEAKTETVKQPDQEGDLHNDNCSPFCHCTCCAGFSFHHPATEIASVVPFRKTQNASPYIASVIEISLPVWQPPQLV
jgi:hypothetical protein